MKLFFFSFLFGALGLSATPYDVLRPFSPPIKDEQIEGIDAIYLINLDKRPEKLEKSLNELKRFNLKAHRFAAINGWALSQDELDSIALNISPEMQLGRWACQLKQNKNLPKEYYFLDKSSVNKPFMSIFLTQGLVGCLMSHLNIIKNAYDAGFLRVLVLEDDIKIFQDPHILSDLIKDLDCKIGGSNWDILHTDLDHRDSRILFDANDFVTDLKGLDLAWFYRPDIMPDQKKLTKRTQIDQNFVKIGSRMRTHALIYNRTGMKKILDFYKSHGHFIPIDHEFCSIPNINIFSLAYDVISFEEIYSDTRGPDL